jgi:hypothetical protein
MRTLHLAAAEAEKLVELHGHDSSESGTAQIRPMPPGIFRRRENLQDGAVNIADDGARFHVSGAKTIG